MVTEHEGDEVVDGDDALNGGGHEQRGHVVGGVVEVDAELAKKEGKGPLIRGGEDVGAEQAGQEAGVVAETGFGHGAGHDFWIVKEKGIAMGGIELGECGDEFAGVEPDAG